MCADRRRVRIENTDPVGASPFSTPAPDTDSCEAHALELELELSDAEFEALR
jgi:hypothetical protein